MKNREMYREQNEAVQERLELSMERIKDICIEEMQEENFADYFQKTAKFICHIEELLGKIEKDWLKNATEEELREENKALYEDILPENYEQSYANPDYACAKLGSDYGKLFSFVYAEIRGMIVYAFEERKEDIAILCELFVQLYTCFGEEMPSYEELKDVVYGNEEKGRKPIKTFIDEVNKYPGLLEIIQGIEGLISGRGEHASGVILYDEDPYDTAAFMLAPNGDLITQFDLHDAEEAGDTKYDLNL